MADPKSDTNYSEPEYARTIDRKTAPFYRPNIDSKIVPETRDLLQNYSHIPPDQQSSHVHKIRDAAFQIRAFPCTGLGAWLIPQLRRHPLYPEILSRTTNSRAKLVDVGTFIGHDLRRLVFDGVSTSENLYGIDIVNHWDVGYDFFLDREKFKAKFIEGDLLSLSSETAASQEMEGLKGKMDFVVISQVLHQWNWAAQVKACAALTALTKVGSVILGNQIGHAEARETFTPTLPTGTWRHNPESFVKLWEEVGEVTGTKWETQGWLKSFEEMSWDAGDAAWMDPGVCILEFAARRVG